MEENVNEKREIATEKDDEKEILRYIDENADDITSVSEVLNSLPEDKKEVILAAFSAIEASISFQGPVPHPDILKGYEDVLPGTAERILSMAEKQQTHGIEMEKFIVKNSSKQSVYGQVWGGIITILCLVVTLVLGYAGHDALAGVIGSTTILGIATIFVLNKKPRKKENEDSE
ncbi:MAG: DUF2335 domain-containing protein [Mediterranea sp.]|jgi:uncharacterized membrane protein|nr:DUF2335 domain-containing protein [Mediterranea sp.]